MGRKEITTKEDLMKVIELFENTGITYWLDGGWGVDILAGKQTRIHRDIDINFDAQHTEKFLGKWTLSVYSLKRILKTFLAGKRRKS